MFFTPELLSRRDGGFGLIWLAATLGPKSSFRKLPRRDVMGADISELCELITEPAEPMALRLSSNLLVGVARVYKVKYDLFVGDITTLSTTLKKAIRDMNSAAVNLQMGQPTVRADAINLTADAELVVGFDFDDFLNDWDQAEEDDDEYGKRAKGKGRAKKAPAAVETSRADAHLLDEGLNDIFANSQLLSHSFEQSFGAQESSSQQGGPGFDPYMGGNDLDLGAVGDELAAELGEDWVAARDDRAMDVDDPFAGGMGMDVDANDFLRGASVQLDDDIMAPPPPPPGPGSAPSSARKRPFDDLEPSSEAQGAGAPPAQTPPPWRDDTVPPAGEEPAAAADAAEDEARPARKAKRVRLVLDARTELTDEELRNARSQYLEGQEQARREIADKKFERESGKLVEEMLWGVPREFQAPALANFWKQRIAVHIEARTGRVRVEVQNTPPPQERESIPREDPVFPDAEVDFGGNYGGDDFRGEEQFAPYENEERPPSLRSSEEPGQARRGSGQMSPLGGQFDLGLGRNAGEPASSSTLAASSQRSIFPWNHAGPGSSSAAGGSQLDLAPGRISIGRNEVRIRASPGGGARSRRESSIHSGHSGVRGFSPDAFAREGSAAAGEDFAFDVAEEGAVPEEQEEEQPQGDNRLITLERNSFEFLEYARHHARATANPQDFTFDVIAPPADSTPRVAAAAFYHCLVLATKDLLRVEQPEPYAPFTIRFVDEE